jgi:hypothetical protein
MQFVRTPERTAALNKQLADIDAAFGKKRPADFDYIADAEAQAKRLKISNEREYTRWHLQDNAQALFAQAYAICEDGRDDFPEDIEAELEELREGEQPCVITAWEIYYEKIEAQQVAA